MTSIYQTDAWASFQRSLGHEVFQRSGDDWQYLAFVKTGRGWKYLYCPYGPRADSAEGFDAALADLARTAKQEKCWFVRIEPHTATLTNGDETPEEALRRRGLREAPRGANPGHTQIIDLTQDDDAILQDMDATNRNRYRNIHKKGVTFTSSTDPADIEILLPFLDAVAEHKRFNRKDDDFLRQAARTLMPIGAATLYVARLNGEPIGATLVYDSDDMRTYAVPAMDMEHRSLNAGKPLVVRMIMDAKAKGLTRFDLAGTAPDGAGPEHQWYGFTKFKLTFGGHPESYPGTWELPVSPLRYMVFPALRTAREKAIMGRWTVRRHVERVRHATLRRLRPSA